MINKALRTEDLDQLQTFRFFIGDLSQSLSYEHQKIFSSDETILTVYRGTKLDEEEFEKLKENQGKIITTNGYLSTSRLRQPAINFLMKPTKRVGVISVLFQIQCDIQHIGNNVIYSDIAQFIINMSLSNEGEKITKDYIDLTQKETEEKSVAIVFGRLMCNLGQYDQSQKYFEELLQKPDGEDIAWIEFNIGQALDYKGQWDQAKIYYDRAYQRMTRATPIRIKDSAQVMNNIGGIFYRQGKYDEALDFHQRALKIREEFCPSDHAAVAQSLNYIGLLF
ncbi:unnamed protein product [Rotaria sordida]|uniref:Uncharacterized protein n=1 Tax=Rotaria sordida TaxID=392033 RepID=A0A815N2E9_9BILA|nr:unnamed protein product [Rotaria sordida]